MKKKTKKQLAAEELGKIMGLTEAQTLELMKLPLAHIEGMLANYNTPLGGFKLENAD